MWKGPSLQDTIGWGRRNFRKTEIRLAQTYNTTFSRYVSHKLIQWLWSIYLHLLEHAYVTLTLFSFWPTCLPNILRLLLSCPEAVLFGSTLVSVTLLLYKRHTFTVNNFRTKSTHCLVYLVTHQQRKKTLLFLNFSFSRCSQSFAQFPFKAQWRHFSKYADSLANHATQNENVGKEEHMELEANLLRVTANVVCIRVHKCLVCTTDCVYNRRNNEGVYSFTWNAYTCLHTTTIY